MDKEFIEAFGEEIVNEQPPNLQVKKSTTINSSKKILSHFGQKYMSSCAKTIYFFVDFFTALLKATQTPVFFLS